MPLEDQWFLVCRLTLTSENHKHLSAYQTSSMSVLHACIFYTSVSQLGAQEHFAGGTYFSNKKKSFIEVNFMNMF